MVDRTRTTIFRPLPGPNGPGYSPGIPAHEEHPVPGQNPNYGRGAFNPSYQPDQFVAHNPSPSQQFEAYVITGFDARPINAIDFNTHTGTNAGGTRFPDTIATVGAPLNQVSLSYQVPAGRVAILRKFSFDMTPFYTGGEAGEPVITPQGSSNFWGRYSILVDDVPQEQQANRVNGSMPFGLQELEAYVIAGSQAIVELRVQGLGPDPAAINTDAVFVGGLLSMYGNVLRQTGREFTQEPATTVSLPVRKGVE